jgi:hypothetical protein
MALSNGKYKGAQLSLTINSVEYNMDLMRAEIVAEEAESDATTFADLASGGSFDWFLDVEYVSDYATGSLWEYIWSNEGDTNIAYKFDPYGVGTTPTASKPHFTGTLTIPGGQTKIGGSADEVFSAEARFKLNGKPTKVGA